MADDQKSNQVPPKWESGMLCLDMFEIYVIKLQYFMLFTNVQK